MTRDQVLNFALYAADVGNQLALSHKIAVRDIPTNWLRNKLFREWNLLCGTGLAASHIATEYSRDPLRLNSEVER